MKAKICSKCDISQPISNFQKRKGSTDGYRGQCKICLNNRAELKTTGTKKCGMCGKFKDVSKFFKNKSRRDGLHHQCKICHTDFQNSNKHKWKIDVRGRRKRKRAYEINKINTDINYKISRILRDRFAKAVKGIYKGGSAVGDLGCSVVEFKAYIENLFEDGMSWDNHGTYGWHFDHIIPLATFDLTKPKQVKKACHYTNIRPLWWHENLSRGKKL